MKRIVTLVAVAAAAYWYWSGPWQERNNPGSSVKENNRKMADCARGGSYIHGATGEGTSANVVLQQCAEKYNVYQVGKDWHSYEREAPPEEQ